MFRAGRFSLNFMTRDRNALANEGLIFRTRGLNLPLKNFKKSEQGLTVLSCST